MNSTPARSSASLSWLPARGGIAPLPLITDCSSASLPVLTRGLVADLGSAGDAGLVAGGAYRFHDLLTRARAGGGARRAKLDAADGLDAGRDGFGRHRTRIGAGPREHELHQQDDGDDRNNE